MPESTRLELSWRLRRVAFLLCYLVVLATGRAAARLAVDFRTLGAARVWLGPLVLVLQLPVLACWLVARPVSVAAYSACCALAPGLSLREPSPSAPRTPPR